MPTPILHPDERMWLRSLATRVREIAQEPVHAENIRLWKALNALQPGRPLIQCDPPSTAWAEILPDRAMRIKDPLFRSVERDLRIRIYRWEHLRDDQPITACVRVPLVRTVSDWWPTERKRPFTSEADQAAKYEPCLLDPADLEKLQMPRLTIDREQSRLNLAAIQDAVGDILEVSQGTPYGYAKGWGESMIDELAQMRGLEPLLWDFHDRPEFVHAAMGFMQRGLLQLLDQYEKEQAFCLNNVENSIGSASLAYTDELPGPGYDPAQVITRNLWGYAMAQELTVASPAVLEEFVLPYQAAILQRFGLTCYGCCESNDGKWGMIKKHIPHLRMVSVSPFSQHELAAEELQDKYVYAWKPHPAAITAAFDETVIRAELTRVFRILRNCRVAVRMLDTQTLHGEPQRLTRWIAIAKEVAELCANTVGVRGQPAPAWTAVRHARTGRHPPD